ncbi:RNA polymerase I-specific transcription initiation factor RRN3 [Lineolata rhizophorae]|uniref:RNA polymerase I-specific transcription initiation factor RRN3 n=1 Tax=Lineolata rhizophorae TaxID=578093 RepID=A0A6A6P758_9PEZI|nr:RNA polymerase I-specific transcription initiation factor RRN3 [Lineolata rhizophorae]
MTSNGGNRVSLKRKLGDTIAANNNNSNNDDDDEPEPSSSRADGRRPGKRARVAFDPAVEVRIMEPWSSEKSVELVRHEVRRGLERRAAGDASGTDGIKALFEARPAGGEDGEEAPSSALLRRYVNALTGNVSLVGKNCAGLVHAVLESEWVGRDEAFVAAYTRFLGGLISAHNGYLRSVMNMLVDKFIELPASSGRLVDHEVVDRAEMQARVHRVVQYVLRLFPSASRTLSPLLAEMFPFSAESTKVHIQYVQSLLKVADYAPELKHQILALMIERVLKIDVQIQVDMEDLDEDMEAAVQEVLDRADDEEASDDDYDSDDGSVASDEEGVESEEKRMKNLKRSLATMDSILDLLFQKYDPEFTKVPSRDADTAFSHLLAQFQNTILPTYRSRHTQFLLFRFTQKSRQYMDQFISTCLNLSFDKLRPPVLRLASSAYLASFVARGVHVNGDIVRDLFNAIGRHLSDFRAAQQSKCTGPDAVRFASYYMLVQAVLYIFCFRWRDLLDDHALEDDITDQDVDDMLLEGRDLPWAFGVKEVLRTNIYSPFNPLKVCSPAIVQQFARIAHHLRFLYVFPLLETNKRLRLSRSVASLAGGPAAAATQFGGDFTRRESALAYKTGDEAFQLDAYFPFDPYQLPRSKRWVESDFVAWKAVPGMEDEDEDEEDSSDEEDEGDEMEEDEVRTVKTATDEE